MILSKKTNIRITLSFALGIILGVSTFPLFAQSFYSSGGTQEGKHGSGGAEKFLCLPPCTTLTAPVIPVNSTTSYTVNSINYFPNSYRGGIAVPLSDDAISAAKPIGFTFCYFGNPYTQFYIGSNGWIGFSAGQTTAYKTVPIPDNTGKAPKNTIMLPWQDLYSSGGKINYALYGTSPFRRLVVSYDSIIIPCSTAHGFRYYQGQVVLYETTNIIENYICIHDNTCNSMWNGLPLYGVQGLHDATGTIAVVVPGRNNAQWISTNEGWRYTPNGSPAYTVTWWDGATQIGNDTSVTVCSNTPKTYVSQVTYACSNTTISDTVIVNTGTLYKMGNIESEAPNTLSKNNIISQSNNLKVYPNPNNGNMQVDYILPDEQQGEFVIFDLIGNRLKSYPMKGGRNTLFIADAELQSGIYFYQVISNGQRIMQDKLVIIK